MNKDQYSAGFKLTVINDADQWDNVSRAAETHNVSRKSIYEWIERREDIEKEAKAEAERESEDISITKRRRDILDRIDKYLPDTIDSADRYLQMLKERGTVSERKEMLNAIVEGTLWQVVEALEDKELGDVHPKDLSKIMMDLEKVRGKLAGEPDFIIEERNKMKNLVVVAAKDLFGEDKARNLIEKIDKMASAEYEEV